MQCPIDGSELMMTARNGVEIDYCPKCRGVWLDRGELDKIIERSGTSMTAEPPRQTQRDDRYRDEDKHRKKKKRSSFLSEIFDFD